MRETTTQHQGRNRERERSNQDIVHTSVQTGLNFFLRQAIWRTLSAKKEEGNANTRQSPCLGDVGRVLHFLSPLYPLSISLSLSLTLSLSLSLFFSLFLVRREGCWISLSPFSLSLLFPKGLRCLSFCPPPWHCSFRSLLPSRQDRE